MNAPTDERRRELDRLQAQIASRASIVHLAHGAVATLLALMVYGLAGLFEWGKEARDKIEYAPTVALAASAVMLYAVYRYVMAYRAHLREVVIFEEVQSLRRELKLEDPSALLPP